MKRKKTGGGGKREEKGRGKKEKRKRERKERGLKEGCDANMEQSRERKPERERALHTTSSIWGRYGQEVDTEGNTHTKGTSRKQEWNGGAWSLAGSRPANKPPSSLSFLSFQGRSNRRERVRAGKWRPSPSTWPDQAPGSPGSGGGTPARWTDQENPCSVLQRKLRSSISDRGRGGRCQWDEGLLQHEGLVVDFCTGWALLVGRKRVYSFFFSFFFLLFVCLGFCLAYESRAARVGHRGARGQVQMQEWRRKAPPKGGVSRQSRDRGPGRRRKERPRLTGPASKSNTQTTNTVAFLHRDPGDPGSFN